MPRFLRNTDAERIGRSVTLSPSNSIASVSPGSSRSSLRRVLGRRTRPALSSVTVMLIGGNMEWEYPFVKCHFWHDRAPEMHGEGRYLDSPANSFTHS